MELVYLWVENYKNIDNQGFNFSPRFTCDYDGKELTIKENNDYIENFFGDNINVTAIVGENGSGKSSVLEIILDSIPKLDCQIYQDKNIYVFSHKGKFYKQHSSQLNIKSNIEIIKIKEDNFRFYDNFMCSSITNDYIKFLNRDEDFLTIVEKKYNSNYNYINKVLILNSKYKYIFNEMIDRFFIPSQLIISVKEDILKEYAKNNKQVQEKIESLKDKTLFNKIKIIIEIFKTKGMTNIFDSLLMSYKIDESLLRKIPHLIKDNTDTNTYKLDITQIDDDMFNFIEELPNIFEINFIDKNNINFNQLSYGEKQLLIQLHLIIYHSSKEKYITYWHDLQTHETDDIPTKIHSHLILLDEVELGLHPNWQKNIILYLIDILKIIKINFQIIITSHSPFLLSDIPKQNIIFLDKDEKGNCKVIDGLKEKKQTFGANIHTLLSDSFFMDDGLMGEFAKRKIDDLINYLNDGKSTIKDNDQAQKLLNIIGEPIIKNQLQRMLDSKRLSKIDAISQKIKDMSYELAVLKEYQSKIVKDELRDKGKKQYKERFIDDKD